jgi:uncharacterized membrane protein
MRIVGLVLAAAMLTGCGSDEGPAEANSAAPRSATVGADENLASGPQVTDGTETTSARGTAPAVSACLMQGNDRLNNEPIRAIGTEPFWGARIEGRCVTYSTPDDQKGTRIWTRHSPAPNGGATWTGQFAGKPFKLRTRPQADCSDGMSDNRYPMAVELTVSGEERRGCAEGL